MWNTAVAFKAAFPIRDLNLFHNGLMTTDTVLLDNLPAPFRCLQNIWRIERVFVNILCPGISLVEQCVRDTVMRYVTIFAPYIIVFPVDIVKLSFISRLHDMARRPTVLSGRGMFIHVGDESYEDYQQRKTYYKKLFVYTW